MQALGEDSAIMRRLSITIRSGNFSASIYPRVVMICGSVTVERMPGGAAHT